MRKYPADGRLRVALLPSINNLASVTLGEIDDGIDVSCDIASGGLRLGKSTATIEQTPWRGPMEVERPTRVSMSGAGLDGFRFEPPDAEPLYDAAVFKAHAFLVVRRGLVTDLPWAVAQVVETYDFRFGKRGAMGSELSMFTVPLFVSEENDAALVAA